MSNKALRHILIAAVVFGTASFVGEIVKAGQLSQPKPTPGDVIKAFSEDASKMMFVARLAVSDHGGATLDPEHFLLAFIQQSANTMGRFVAPEWPLPRLEAEIAKTLKAFPKPSEEADVSPGPRTTRLLVAAAEIAVAEGSASVRPEDLLRAMINDQGTAGNLLRQAGVTAEGITSVMRRPSK